MLYSFFKRFFILTMVFAGLSSALAMGATVETALSDNQAYVGVPVSLYIRISNAENQTQPQIPEVSGLQIESSGIPSRSSQTTIINGRRTDRTSVTYAWSVTPRRAGNFVIPGVSVQADGRTEQTQPLGLTATKSETGDLLFVEVDGKQDKIFVGQSLDLVLRVFIKPYHDPQFDVSLSPSDMWDLVSEHSQWGAFGKTLEKLADDRQRVVGRRALHADAQGEDQVYYAYEIPATIYPTRPGEVDSGDTQIVMQYPTALQQSRGFFSSGGLSIARARPLVENAQVPTTLVVPIPEVGRPADYRGAVGHYEMITRAQPQRVKAGDPITLNIGIRGDGPMELVQAPPLAELAFFTENFKVPDESLAGIVEGDVKVFSVDIRPRKAGVTEIPSLPLSFFDPQTEKFETVFSLPIPIEVEAADQLSLSSVVASSAARTSNEEKEDPPVLMQIALNHHQGTDLLDNSRQSEWWPIVLGLSWAPLLFLLLSIVQFGPRMIHRWDGGHRLARKRTEQVLKKATTAEEVHLILLKYIAALTNTSSGSLTRVEAVNLIRGGASEETVEKFDHLLTTCEKANYAGASNTDAQILAERGWVLLREFAGLNLKKSRRKRVLRTAVLVGGLFTGGLLGMAAGELRAADLNYDQRAQILAEASDAYQHGLASSADAAVSKEAFSEAARKYQLLVDQGISNSKLYSNLATSYLQTGKVAHALVNYERTLSHAPSDSLAQAGRDHALFLLTGEQQEVEQSFSAHVQSWNAKVPYSFRVWTGVFCWSVFWVALAAAFSGGIRPCRKVALAAAIGCVLCGASLTFQNWQDNPVEHGVVIAKDVQLREGNGEGFASVEGMTLSEGSRFEVVQKRGDWIRVRTTDGHEGWLAAGSAELIPLHDRCAT